MKQQAILSVSLVLYKNDPILVQQVILSIINSPIKVQIFIFDNSPTPVLANLFTKIDNVNYFYNNGKNYGFGKAHNLAISKLEISDYHIVINPDVYFDTTVISELIDFLEKNQDVALIQPKILYPSGQIQYLCKHYPTLFALFARRFIPEKLHFILKRYLHWYEMRDMGYDKITDVIHLSGCFMLFRKKYLDEIGYFDENIFMYLEDADITLRMAKKYRTVFYPDVHIYHHWAKGSYKSLKLTLINIQSAIYFFNKHGWKFY